jgi:hypothetical protein
MAGKLMRQAAILTLLITAGAVAGCDRMFASQPATQDLVGVYRLSPASEAFLRTTKRYKVVPVSEVELKSGSKVSIRNLPDCAINGFGDSGGAFLSGDGMWRIEKDFVGHRISLDIKPGGSLKEGGYGGSWMVIRRRTAPHILEITVGDPDSGESIRYERDSANKPLERAGMNALRPVKAAIAGRSAAMR